MSEIVTRSVHEHFSTVRRPRLRHLGAGVSRSTRPLRAGRGTGLIAALRPDLDNSQGHGGAALNSARSVLATWAEANLGFPCCAPTLNHYVHRDETFFCVGASCLCVVLLTLVRGARHEESTIPGSSSHKPR